MKPESKNWGGKRKGAGRKFTGVNTVTISFSVHKDFAEIIRATVFDKIKELKQGKDRREKPNNLKSVTIDDKRVPVEKDKPFPPKIKITVPKESTYLKQRRQMKSGVKK